jgi:hypothetical protein
MVAVRPCDVAYSGPAGDGGRGALLVAGERALPVSGEPLVFLAAVACAPAVVGRDGRVRAGGWLPDHVRLGLLEHHLDAGVIEQLVVAAVAAGRVKAGQRRRVMSLELVMRFVVAMTLMPDACYREVMARLVGLLPQVPWARPWRVPGSKVMRFVVAMTLMPPSVSRSREARARTETLTQRASKETSTGELEPAGAGPGGAGEGPAADLLGVL